MVANRKTKLQIEIEQIISSKTLGAGAKTAQMQAVAAEREAIAKEKLARTREKEKRDTFTFQQNARAKDRSARGAEREAARKKKEVNTLESLTFEGKKASETFRDLSNNQNAQKLIAEQLGIPTRQLSGAIKDNKLAIVAKNTAEDNNIKNLELAEVKNGELTKVTDMQSKSVQKITDTYKAFNFKMLNYLFIGQAVERVTWDMFRSNFALQGIFEATSKIIDVAMMPAYLPFSKVLLDLSMRFKDLPEPIRAFIGGLSLSAGILSSLTQTAALLTMAFGGVTAATIMLGIAASGGALISLGLLWEKLNALEKVDYAFISRQMSELMTSLGGFGIGAVAGGAIGTAIAPGVGTAIGAGIGGLVGLIGSSGAAEQAFLQGQQAAGIIPSTTATQSSSGGNTTLVQNVTIYDIMTGINQLNADARATFTTAGGGAR